jgi:poly-gamma-glutamate capsule biosynthesis protein CapA/YwtB (metallophosphatase superfamily)
MSPKRKGLSLPRRLAAGISALGILAGACSNATATPTIPPQDLTPIEPIVAEPVVVAVPHVAVSLVVVDETGAPIPGATVDVAGRSVPADATGRAEMSVNQPILAIVTAPGHLPEPAVVGTDSAPELTVGLISRTGADGTERFAVNFAGDMMLGRRYLEPTREGTAVVDPTDDGTSARAVVSDVAPLFGAADISSVNFESVIGSLPAEAAYPAKRFLLQSPPNAVAALDELGADVVTLGNNHLNDWLAAGVESTVDHLRRAGYAAPGGGSTSSEARAGSVLDLAGRRIGFLSYTTVNGDFVNDNLPVTGDLPPADLSPDEAWQYETRRFGYASPDSPIHVPLDDYRLGDIWSAYDNIESEVEAVEAAELWASIVGTFPELQDWVARRGHGGAAWFRRSAVGDDIAAMREEGADLVIVQIHGGYQFAETASAFFVGAAHASIDAGADLVVGHHPHVLQGFEWYQGKLIAHSLGNFVFDQDFLSTFPSVVLRTVFEGDQLLEARVYPVMLDNYRPVPVGGATADRIVGLLDERSAGATQTVRLPNGTIGSSIVDAPAEGAASARVLPERGTGVITKGRQVAVPVPVPLNDDGFAPLPANSMVRAESSLSGIWLGRDIYGWGDFEDATADGSTEGGLHWQPSDGGNVAVVAVEDGETGHHVLEISSGPSYANNVVTRPVARVAVREHRIYDGAGFPQDGSARYSVHLKARMDGDTWPVVRVDAYYFYDADPTRDPESTLIRRVEVPFDIPSDGEWHEFDIELPSHTFMPGPTGSPATAAMFYLGLAPPAMDRATIQLDDVAFVEWREASELPGASWNAADFVKVEGPRRAVTLLIS